MKNMYATQNCLLQVAPTNSPIVYTVIPFWLLLTQLVSVSTVSSNKNNNYYMHYDKIISNLLPPHSIHTAEFDARQQLLPSPLPLMDKTLTHFGNSKDSTNWQPVCATTNSVDYVLFSSECLLQQTNRMNHHHHLDTGETKSVFRKIAMGFCRPNCNVIICESNEETICAQNVRNDEVRLFSEHCEMARDVCLHDNEWQPISEVACKIKSDEPNAGRIPTSSTQIAAIPTTTNYRTSITSNITTLSKHSTNLAKKQTKKALRKSIPCPKIFNPVCAELFGVKTTFINECLVNAENVKFGKTWQILSEGVCAEDYASSEKHKNIINKRSVIDSATVTYKLYTPQMALKGNTLWTPNSGKLYYLNPNVMDVYGRRQHQLAQKYTIRIFPDVDDRVTVCKFGVGSICGSLSNGTMHAFENICELMLRNIILNETWSVENEKKCSSEKCILNCTTTYDPVCISRNGINYTIINQCHVDYAFCQYKQNSLKILGKGECKNVLQNFDQIKKEYALKESTSPSSNSNDEYSLRLVRKTFESPAEQGKNNNSLSSSILQNLSVEQVTENPVEFVIAPSKTLKSCSESSEDKCKLLDSITTTESPIGKEKQDVSESHVMILWRSSKRK